MNSADDVTCLCEATLTARRTAGQNTGNLQIPLENLALRFASRVKSSLMYAQMLPLYLQRALAPTRPPITNRSFPERPDRIHHMDLGFYRYFASSLSRYYTADGRCEYAARSPTTALSGKKKPSVCSRHPLLAEHFQHPFNVDIRPINITL